jgi:RNA polymerase sigma-70 factor, ECF subfamily
MRNDPLADPLPLIRRVYSFVAYRIGDGPDAEDVTSATVERALRYRASFDPAKGKPLGWLIGIARSCIDDHLRAGYTSRLPVAADVPDTGDEEGAALLRLTVADLVSELDDRDRELIALRYGADLSAREIGDLLDMTPNAVDVALHRCRGRLEGALAGAGIVEARLAPSLGTGTAEHAA